MVMVGTVGTLHLKVLGANHMGMVWYGMVDVCDICQIQIVRHVNWLTD